MEKRKYSKPTLYRVALNHTQAVLTSCYVGWTGNKGARGQHQCNSSKLCRQFAAGGDSTSAS